MELQIFVTEQEMDDMAHGRTITVHLPLEHLIVRTRNDRRSKRVRVEAASVGPNETYGRERALFVNLKMEAPDHGQEVEGKNEATFG